MPRSRLLQKRANLLSIEGVLRRVAIEIGSGFGFVPSPSELNCLVDSLKNWMPFPDTVEALQTLKKRFKLAIISNIDDDLFAMSAKHLKVGFDWLITAERVGSYKPALSNFEFALGMMRVSPGKVLHIAQSIYHDIIPARALGLSTVWVNRRPDLEVPDLKTLVSIIGEKA